MNEKTTIKRWNIADRLKTDEDLQRYISSLLEDVEEDPAFVALALADIAKAKGMDKVVEQLGLTEADYLDYSSNSAEITKTVSSGLKSSPSFISILKMIKALGFAFEIKPISKLANQS